MEDDFVLLLKCVSEAHSGHELSCRIHLNEPPENGIESITFYEKERKMYKINRIFKYLYFILYYIQDMFIFSKSEISGCIDNTFKFDNCI